MHEKSSAHLNFKKGSADRLDWIERMVREIINTLPLENYAFFIADRRNVWASKTKIFSTSASSER